MKTLALSLALVSSLSFAHSQTPVSYGGVKNLEQAVSLEDTKVIQFTIKNLNTTPSRYDLYVDDDKVHTTKMLSKGGIEQVPVIFHTKELNKAKTYRMCSKSLNESGIRTKVCSRVQLVRM